MIPSDDFQNRLKKRGYLKDKIELNDTVKSAVMSNDWDLLDQEFQKLTSNNGELYKYLENYCAFTSIEFIISIRDCDNEWEEDGIWHDDGSRVLAFSLSLTNQSDLIEGGTLEIRKKGDLYSQKIPPFEFGQIIVFLTGTSGYEHKINKVTKGKRIIIAGWCS